jgi:phospholipase C
MKAFEYKRRRRCASCGRLINHDEEAVFFDRVRAPKSDIEERIHGEEVPIAPLWHCEDCASIYVNLYELGYNCMDPSQPVQDYLKEYWEMTGFDPKKYAAEGGE